VTLLVYVLVLLAVGVPIYWLEAAWGRAKLRDRLAGDGWTLVEARWRPAFPLRQARFAVEVDRDGQRVRGTARVGGSWTGPVFSNHVDVDFPT
jgi:hypothetical protein